MKKLIFRLANSRHIYRLFTEYLVERNGSRMRFAREGLPL